MRPGCPPATRSAPPAISTRPTRWLRASASTPASTRARASAGAEADACESVCVFASVFTSVSVSASVPENSPATVRLSDPTRSSAAAPEPFVTHPSPASAATASACPSVSKVPPFRTHRTPLPAAVAITSGLATRSVPALTSVVAASWRPASVSVPAPSLQSVPPPVKVCPSVRSASVFRMSVPSTCAPVPASQLNVSPVPICTWPPDFTVSAPV